MAWDDGMTWDEQRDRAWGWMLEMGIATEDEMKLVCNINGFSLETLEDILYAKTGYRSFDQVMDEAVW